MKRILTVIAISLLYSCNTGYYQIAKTESANVQSGIYEDENCRITYNLWSEGGDAGFVFTNKTDDAITMNFDQSFFIKNGLASDYFQHRQFSKTVNQSVVVAIPLGNYWANRYQKASSSGNSSGTEYIERPQIVIPAKSSKIFTEFRVSDSRITHCDFAKFPTKSKPQSLSFTKSDSPVNFSNIIVYSLKGKPFTVRNDFYVSEVRNVTQESAFVNQKVNECGKSKTIKVSKFSEPGAYYHRYGQTK